MPAFREGPIKVDRSFSGDLLKALYDTYPEDRITIVNSTYDIPAIKSRLTGHPLPIHHGGPSTAQALTNVARLIPIHEGSVRFMGPDEYAQDYGLINVQSYHRFREAAAKLVHETGIFLDLSQMDEVIDSADLGRFRDDAPDAALFHEWADHPGGSGDDVLFIRTDDPLPFACVTFETYNDYEV